MASVEDLLKNTSEMAPKVEETISLTEALERGIITPSEYARLRADIVGEGSIFEYILIPIFFAFWRRLFPSRSRF